MRQKFSNSWFWLFIKSGYRLCRQGRSSSKQMIWSGRRRRRSFCVNIVFSSIRSDSKWRYASTYYRNKEDKDNWSCYLLHSTKVSACICCMPWHCLLYKYTLDVGVFWWKEFFADCVLCTDKYVLAYVFSIGSTKMWRRPAGSRSWHKRVLI